MAEPTPVKLSWIWRSLKAIGIEVPAELIGAGTVAGVLHLLSGKGAPPKGDVRLAIAKIPVPEIDFSRNEERRARVLARREEALQKKTQGFALLDAQNAADPSTEKRMNIVRSTDEWTAIFAGTPVDEWIRFIPKPEDVPQTTAQRVKREIKTTKDAVVNYYETLNNETREGFQGWADWITERQKSRAELTKKYQEQGKKINPWLFGIIGGVLLVRVLWYVVTGN